MSKINFVILKQKLKDATDLSTLDSHPLETLMAWAEFFEKLIPVMELFYEDMEEKLNEKRNTLV